jgi:hypothetical protein
MSVNLGPGLHVAVGRAVDTSSYDRWVGRWSRLFVPAVLAAAEVASGDRVLDVATGTGGAALGAPVLQLLQLAPVLLNEHWETFIFHRCCRYVVHVLALW